MSICLHIVKTPDFLSAAKDLAGFAHPAMSSFGKDKFLGTHSKQATCSNKKSSGARFDHQLVVTKSQVVENITIYKAEHLPSKQMAGGSSPPAPSTFQQLTPRQIPTTPCVLGADMRILCTYCAPGELQHVTHECPHCGATCDCEWGTEDVDHCEHQCRPVDDDEDDD